MGQSGRVRSIVVYGGVVVALAVLLVGGVYVIRQQVTQASSTTGTMSPLHPSDASENASKRSKDADKPPAELEREKPSSRQTTSESELPQTGSSETFYSALIVATITGMGVAYIRSRRYAAAF